MLHDLDERIFGGILHKGLDLFGAGGRPVRSKEARRISARLLAGGSGSRPFSSRRARMKRSTGVRAHAAFFGMGIDGVRIG